MTHTADIAIVGGGLTGPALALACAGTGLTSLVLDSSTAAPQNGRAYALAQGSLKMLQALGLWDTLAAEAQPILEVKASDGRPGEGASPFFLHFDRAELEGGPLGAMVEDRHLRPALMAAMAGEARIDHRPGETVVAQEVGAGAARLTLASGAEIAARLIVGADGRQSGTAARAGIRTMRKDYGQVALVATICHAEDHRGVAQQFFMPGGPLAILPLKGRRSSIVWSEAREAAERYAALDDAGFLAVLRPRVGAYLGEIALEGPRWRYPLGLSLAQRIVAERLVLVGDAAQAVHPIAGQGLNQGLRDVATLAEVLAEARRRGEDIGAAQVLERHRRWRSFDRAALAVATDGFNRLFSNDNPLLRLGRDIGLGLATAVPGLRRGLMREAAGLSGDVPRLMRGRPV